MENCKMQILLQCGLAIAFKNMRYIIASSFILDMWGFVDAGIVFMEKIVYKKTSYGTL